MHTQPTSPLPMMRPKRKYKRTATAIAMAEQMNCRRLRPKKMDS